MIPSSSFRSPSLSHSRFTPHYHSPLCRSTVLNKLCKLQESSLLPLHSGHAAPSSSGNVLSPGRKRCIISCSLKPQVYTLQLFRHSPSAYRERPGLAATLHTPHPLAICTGARYILLIRHIRWTGRKKSRFNNLTIKGHSRA